jgi:septal ring factor EnvC (AmiA/AmiB activator)
MGRLAQGVLLLVLGALILTLFYWEPSWLTQWTDYSKFRPYILSGSWILCSAGLALVTYAIGFALAEKKYTLRINSLTERVEERRRELKNLSQRLGVERGELATARSELATRRRELITARKQVIAAEDQLAIKRRQLAVLSGKLGDKEKRLKKIREVASGP